MKYIDIHGHINFAVYDSDREEVIERSRDLGVGIITVGTDLKSSVDCVKLAEKHDDMWAIIGLHPTNTGESFNDPLETGIGNMKEVRQPVRNGQGFDRKEFLELAKHPKVVAIGECGLDYFHSKVDDFARQEEVFIEHIKVANEVGKPLMIHARNGAQIDTKSKISDSVNSHPLGGRGSLRFPLAGFEERSYSPQKDAPISAYQNTIQILKKYSKVPADFHFFAGTEDDMKAILQIGCSVSFTGVITFARSYDNLIRNVPLDKIMSETDCPYVAPIPHRGKRCEPSYVIEVVKQIAKIRNEDEDAISSALLNNARRFFRI